MSATVQPSLQVAYREAGRPSLALEPLTNGALHALGQPDPAVLAITSMNDQRSLERQLADGVSAVTRPCYQWSLHAALPGEAPALVGIAGLYDRDTDTPEVGAIIFREEWLNRGLGGLTWLAITRAAAFDAGAKAVRAVVLADNVRSQRSLQRIGFMQAQSRGRGVMSYGDGIQVSGLTDWVIFSPDRAQESVVQQFPRLRDSRQVYTDALSAVTLRTARPKVRSR